MKKKKPLVTIKNFRSFGENGGSVELAPISILTGCNSSGKSSLVKALLLISDVSKQIKKSFEINTLFDDVFQNIKLHVTKSILQLGGYDNILNKNSEKDAIVITYEVFSEILMDVLKIELTFHRFDNIVNDGVLSGIRILRHETLVYEWSYCKKNDIIDTLKHLTRTVYDTPINYCSFEEAFREYMTYLMHRNVNDHNPFREHSISKEEQEHYNSFLKDFINSSNYKEDKSRWKKVNMLTRYELPIQTIQDYLEMGILHTWLPIFKEAKGMTKLAIREWMTNKAKEFCNEINQKPIDWVNFFCDDFEASIFETLPEYIRNIEKKNLRIGDLGNKRNLGNAKDILWTDGANIHLSRTEFDENSSYSFIISAFELFCYGKNSVNPITCEYTDKPEKNLMVLCLRYFATTTIVDAITVDNLTNVTYINSSSAKIDRLYVVDSNDKLVHAIKEFSEISVTHKNGQYCPMSFVNKWCKEFAIGDSVSIERIGNGAGIQIFIEKNGIKQMMADEGYGITQLFTLLINIENCVIMQNGDSHTIFVEEPEVHLHPKYQSLLAEMFLEAYQQYNIHFVIETHSEYLIRKIQVMVAGKDCKLQPSDVSINYVEKDANGISTNRQIKIEDDGRLSEPFGEGFYDEADSLALELMRFKARKK